VKKNVVVLGMHDGHNSSAALIKNGSVVAAIQEERLVNQKNYSGIPYHSIQKVFEISNIHPSDVDVIAIAGHIHSHISLKEHPLHVRLYERYARLFSSHAMTSIMIKIMQKFRNIHDLTVFFKEINLENAEIIFIDHHLAHAACAYYQRPHEAETLVLTLDGAGDGLCSTVSIGDKYSIHRIASTTAYNSPGNVFYSEITGYLGLKRWEHEYKVMGMAPYGISDYCINEIRKIVRVNPTKPLEFENTIGGYVTHVQKKLIRLLSEQRFDNISAATQQHYEEILTQWVTNAVHATNIRKIACAGGMFLNVKANKILRELDIIDDIFIYPAASDEGIPVGAAMEGYYRFCEREGITPKKDILGPIYYGMDYNNEYIKKALTDSGWIKHSELISDIDQELGEKISHGNVIARFKGRDEWGPRGLGNRSILADPRDLKIIRKINFAIKHRDFWMPFAPSVLDEHMKDYFVNPRFAPYMIEAFDSTPLAEEIIAGLHPNDLTGRPQAVNNWNNDYQKVLLSFQETTGVGGILNTSFNLHGYPIVGTPEIALDTFKQSDLDGLAIGNWLVMKK
jgi:carbamoyltransferase